MSDNLRIWNAVRAVDPKHCKPIVGKPYKGTTVKFQALCQMATQLWGPCGTGWGWTTPEQLIVPMAEGEILHIASLTLWYLDDGKRCEGVPHVGQTYLVRKGKNGLASDEDAPKKSVTDALTKALSCIGFAADIYMGLWDDGSYDPAAEYQKAQPKTELPETIQVILDGISTAPTPVALRTFYEQHWPAVPKEHRRRVMAAKDARKAALNLVDQHQ